MDGLSYRDSYIDGLLPDTSVQPILGRSYLASAEIGVLEIFSCRAVPPGFGLYQGAVLIDDFREGSPGGPHATSQYVLIRRDGQWVSLGVEERVWANCSNFDESDWIDVANELLPDPIPWELFR